MKVQDIMTTSTVTIEPRFSLRQAARKMSELGVGSIIIAEEGKLLGIITDRDIACFAVAMGRDSNSTEVGKVMTKEVTTCFSDQDVGDAAHMMEQHGIRRLPVIDHDNSLVGFLSVDDLARFSHELAGEVLSAATPTH